MDGGVNANTGTMKSVIQFCPPHVRSCLWSIWLTGVLLATVAQAQSPRNADCRPGHCGKASGTPAASGRTPNQGANTEAWMSLSNQLQVMDRQQREERAQRERQEVEQRLKQLQGDAGQAALSAADVSCAQQISDASSKSLLDMLDAPNGRRASASGVQSAPCKVATSPAQPATNRPGAKEGACRMSLQFMSAKLPAFSDEAIAQIRNQIVQTDVRETVNAAKAQGFNASSAVEASLKQAKEHDRVARQGVECAADVSSWGGTDEDFYQAINSGRIHRGINCQSSIQNSCLCAGIINKMAAAGARAVAASMQCLAKNGQW